MAGCLSDALLTGCTKEEGNPAAPGNQPPNQPSNPVPADGAAVVSLSTSLRWTCSDPDGDSLNYNLFFGATNNPPLVRQNMAENFWTPDSVTLGTTYYWKVVAKDSLGHPTEGPMWRFATFAPRTFGGAFNDYAFSVQQTSDGGFIIAGETGSFGAGADDVYLIKTDAGGNQTWFRTFGGAFGGWAQSVQQTSDGGFIIAGGTYSFGAGENDVYLIKTDAGGNQTWERTFGGASYDWAESVQQTSDGGFIIAGMTGSFGAGEGDVYLIKTDAGGNQTWERTFGGASYDLASSVQQTLDGGFIIAGATQSFGAGGEDVYLIKTDSGGNPIWSRTLGGEDNDYTYSVQQTSDGGFIIAGVTQSFGAGEEDAYLIKADAGGIQTWFSAFGGASGDGAYSVQQTSDGGFIIAGGTGSFGAGREDVYLLKTNAGGKQTWFRTFGGAFEDWAYSVQQTSDGGFIIAGVIEPIIWGSRDAYLIKTDVEGNMEW